MCLSTGKEVGQYREILAHVKDQVQQITGHRWRPDSVVTDFESSLLLAIETELPRTRKQGCYFHFCQALWRRIQRLGLAAPYENDARLRKCLRKYMAIG